MPKHAKSAKKRSLYFTNVRKISLRGKGWGPESKSVQIQGIAPRDRLLSKKLGIKPKAKVLQETVEWYKNWPPAFFESFGKPVAAIPAAPIATKAIKPVSRAISESYLALAVGLKRAKPVLEEIKPATAPFAEFRDLGRFKTPTGKTPLELEILKGVQKELAGRVRLAEFLDTKTAQRFKESLGIKPISKIAAKQAEAQLFQPLQIPRTAQRTLQKELELLKQPTITKAIFRFPKPPITKPRVLKEIEKALPKPLPTLPPFPPLFFERPKKKKKAAPGKGFDVLLKVRGQFRKQNVRPLHKSTAIALGSFLADETAAQTFKTRATGRKATGLKKKATRLRKFRKPIRKGVPQRDSPLFIEKTAFLIDRPQEKQDITAAGLKALRTGFFAKIRKKLKKKRAR